MKTELRESKNPDRQEEDWVLMRLNYTTTHIYRATTSLPESPFLPRRVKKSVK
jgi:hypothetical protein